MIFQNGQKKLLMIAYYRMPVTSSDGIHTNKAQLNQKNKYVKTTITHREEMLKDITRYVQSVQANDIIIAGNLNKNIGSKVIE